MTSSTGEPDLNRDLIVVGGSAGAVEALCEIVRGLPPDLPAAVLIAVHRGLSEGPCRLAEVLADAGPLPAATAHEGRHLRRGHV